MNRRRITSLEDPAFLRLFTGIRHSWKRLETLQAYDVSYERADYEAFLSGERLRFEVGEWEEMIIAHTATGKSLQRVHVVETPPSDYIRYELACYEVSSAAGEDIRVIPVRPGQWPPGVARSDYWVFDDSQVWRMAYDTQGRFLHAQRRNRDLRAALASWAAAWRQAVPLAEVAAPLLAG